jgi:hypothetical protein
MMISYLFYTLIIIGLGIPAGILLFTGYIVLGLITLVVCAGWVLGIWKAWRCVNDVALVAGTTMIGIAAFLTGGTIWAIFCIIFILIAWTLVSFQTFLKLASPDDDLRNIKQAFLKKVLIFSLICLLFSVGSITIRLQITFLQAVLLLMMSFLGLLQLVRGLMKE